MLDKIVSTTQYVANNSINVKLIAQKIAQIKNISLEEIAKVTYENAKNVFRIE